MSWALRIQINGAAVSLFHLIMAGRRREGDGLFCSAGANFPRILKPHLLRRLFEQTVEGLGRADGSHHLAAEGQLGARTPM
jgi:hypothetical protein